MDRDSFQVSVCLITYNHKQYIVQAIDSVLSQIANFPFELIIADDFSIDGTRDILIDYQLKYPQKIKLILQNKNVGAAQNWLDLIYSPKSDYIAYLEGDDYWIDPLKLQKQYDFMKKNKDCSLSFHNAKIINEVNNTSYFFSEYEKNEYTGDDFLNQWLIPSAAIFFKNPFSYPFFFQTVTHGDLALFLYLTEFGKVKYIDEVMSVYRINSSGATQTILKGINHNLQHISQLELMIEYFGDKYKIKLKQRIANYLISTAYLYAKEGEKKKSIQYFYKAAKMSRIEILKGVKYIIQSFYYLLKN